MAKSRSIFDAPSFYFEGGVLTIKTGRDVAFTEDSSGNWTYQLGANSFTLTAAQVATIQTINLVNPNTHLDLSAALVNGENFAVIGAGALNISGVVFTEAFMATPFETSVNIGSLELAVATTVNGDTGSYFATLWDTLDDAYGALSVQGFNNALFGVGGYASNVVLATPVLGETTVGAAASAIVGGFINLGVAYVNYLVAGGDALDYFTAKASVAGRDQTVHDNILGNVTDDALLERQFIPPANIASTVPGDWETRDLYSGNPGLGAVLAATVAFDVAHGVERDYAFG